MSQIDKMAGGKNNYELAVAFACTNGLKKSLFNLARQPLPRDLFPLHNNCHQVAFIVNMQTFAKP